MLAKETKGKESFFLFLLNHKLCSLNKTTKLVSIVRALLQTFQPSTISLTLETATASGHRHSHRHSLHMLGTMHSPLTSGLASGPRGKRRLKPRPTTWVSPSGPTGGRREQTPAQAVYSARARMAPSCPSHSYEWIDAILILLITCVVTVNKK